jgi:putative flippase GtrA
VDIVRTVLDDLKGMARVARKVLSGAANVNVPPRVRQAKLPTGMTWQLASFAVIGVLSTLAYLVLYLLLRQFLPAWFSNGVALFVTAIANTAANRRFTFGFTGTRDALKHQVEGMIAFLIGLALSEAALGAVKLAAPHASHLAELATLVGANALATVVRFLLMRVWIFNPRRHAGHRARSRAAQLR